LNLATFNTPPDSIDAKGLSGKSSFFGYASLNSANLIMSSDSIANGLSEGKLVKAGLLAAGVAAKYG
jgi:hypothetical protein